MKRSISISDKPVVEITGPGWYFNQLLNDSPDLREAFRQGWKPGSAAIYHYAVTVPAAAIASTIVAVTRKPEVAALTAVFVAAAYLSSAWAS